MSEDNGVSRPVITNVFPFCSNVKWGLSGAALALQARPWHSMSFQAVEMMRFHSSATIAPMVDPGLTGAAPGYP